MIKVYIKKLKKSLGYSIAYFNSEIENSFGRKDFYLGIDDLNIVNNEEDREGISKLIDTLIEKQKKDQNSSDVEVKQEYKLSNGDSVVIKV